MKCPECGCEESKVIDSRPTENKVRRRRECIQCGFRFTTYEIIEDIPLMVIKKDNSIEPFDRQKLVDRLCRAAVKRPVKLETIENMVDEIAAELKNSLQREVTSEKIVSFGFSAMSAAITVIRSTKKRLRCISSFSPARLFNTFL